MVLVRKDRMNWSRLRSLDTWKGVALETAWKVRSISVSKNVSPTWRFKPQEIEAVHILWPLKYEWTPACRWVEPLFKGLSKYVMVERTGIPQKFKGIVLIQLVVQGARHDVAIDYSDGLQINEECMRQSLVYFKMQFARTGYPTGNIVPGGFVPFTDAIYQYLPYVRALTNRKSICYDVYGRFGLEFAKEIRRKACSLLAQQSYFRWEGGVRKKRYSLALRDIARSRICIDLPGNGDFCFRLIDYFAVGACVIAPKHHTAFPIPVMDREHIVYAKEDLSDLVDLCRFYLNNDEARREVVRNSRLYFDRYLHRDQLAAYYLRCCVDALK